MEYAIYSVISPEGCAAILWSDRTKAKHAAEALRLTTPDLLELGMIDGVIEEPVGGAHRDPRLAAANLKAAVLRNLDHLDRARVDDLLARRLDKYSGMGFCREG
jgi:acetyl-CoA carboxylase carboxyl transferase subunit alpha